MAMDQSEIVVAGYQGALAEKTVALLAAAGHTIRRLPRSEQPDLSGEGSARVLIVFPFDLSGRNPERWEGDVQWIRSLAESARVSGIERVVLRSHVVAYGFSFKNYGRRHQSKPRFLIR